MSREHHVYTRHIDPQERTSLSVLASKVRARAQVLDLGCGSGALGAFLHQQLGCVVDGVTLSRDEAALAQPHYRDVVVADLEQIHLAQAFSGQRYDYIVCADVLEHLKHPERILSDCRALLAPDGHLLVSLPNASYCGLLIELMQGDFRYRPEGLLDETHLRFFTRQSMLRFLRSEAWSVDVLDTIERPLDESEFKHITADSLPPTVLRYLLAQPDALTYQFICSARPSSDAAARQTTALLTSSPPATASFTSNLYWADADQFSEARKLILKGEIGRLHQCMRFDLPQFDGATPTLRWDPADRPGFLHLHRIRLKDGAGMLRWSWSALAQDGDALAQQPHSAIVWQPAPATAPGSTLLLLSGDDPWTRLPIPPELLRTCLQTEGATLEFELGWPMSADYAALAGRTRELQQTIHRADREVQHWQTAHQAAAQAQTEAHHHILHLQEQLQIQRQDLQTCIEEQQAHIQDQQAHIHHLQTHVQQIESSGTYRAAQKMSRAKALLTGRAAAAPAAPPATAQSPAATPAPAPVAALQVPPAAPSADAVPAPASAPATDPAAPPPQPQAAATPAAMVDIIIPVYRGLDDTRRCIQSVLNAPVHAACQLIVINDASPEPALTAWLRELAARESRVTLLENTDNLGFVGTANRGMALHPAHDVLLLNSDTEVASHWLDRLRTAAYSGSDVGSATPLSNNATICSYPRFCESNALPPGQTTASLNQLCLAANAGQHVDVPTGVGFCMYIRRDCLTQTGWFDEAHFGKGYGEENDFCMRAHTHGWRHLLALDTFVLHTGGVSFGDSKTPREQAAFDTLKTLHPTYETLVHNHLKDNPAQAARNAIDKARMRLRPEPRILMVMHNEGGGTKRHVQELAAYLHGKAIVISLTPLPDHYVRLDWLDPAEGYSEKLHGLTQADELLALLRGLGVQHIHFHHLLGLDMRLMRLPQQLGVTYDFTAHDYYTACPQITMTLADHTYCGELGPDQCAGCLHQRPAPTHESIDDWRVRHRTFLNQARYLLTPSKDAARRLLRYFPHAAIRNVSHHDIPDASALPHPHGHTLPAHANLRVFILGGVSAAKGGDVMEAVALAAARANAPIELHLLGYPHRQMRLQPQASLTIHGPYADADLPQLLARLKPDLVWFPALWPETYSYTLSACLLAGLPVVAPDIGAFTERLSERPWTWLRPWNTTPDDWLALFQDIRQRQFVQGEAPPPAPTAPGSALDAQLPPWSYAHDYLRGIGPAQNIP